MMVADLNPLYGLNGDAGWETDAGDGKFLWKL